MTFCCDFDGRLFTELKENSTGSPYARGPHKIPGCAHGHHVCAPVFCLSLSRTPFFSCSAGGGGILSARALRKSARPVALRMPRTTVVVVVVVGSRASENSGRRFNFVIGKRFARNRRFPRETFPLVSRRAETSIFLPRENARVIYRVSRIILGDTSLLRRLEKRLGGSRFCRFNFLLDLFCATSFLSMYFRSFSFKIIFHRRDILGSRAATLQLYFSI